MTDRSPSADARAHAARAAGQPQPDLREQLAEALRTTPSVLMDTPEERDRHAATPRNHHISHHYYWGCAMCRGEVDTLADALLAVVRPSLDAKQAEIVRLLAFLERGFDTHMQFGVIEPDGATTMLPCADWCHACKLEKAEAERERLAAEVDAWQRRHDDYEQAHRTLVARCAQLVFGARACTHLLRATADRCGTDEPPRADALRGFADDFDALADDKEPAAVILDAVRDRMLAASEHQGAETHARLLAACDANLTGDAE